jgi:oligoribonuclease
VIVTDHLLWLDLETTGTDETKDSIIEIGCVLTDIDLEVKGEYVSFVRPTDEALGRLLRNDVVREMHTVNGLLADLIAPSGKDLDHPQVVQTLVSDWLQDIVGNQRVALAGSGVAHFDRRFLDAQMPKVTRSLTYWTIDVGVIRRAFHMATNAQFTTARQQTKTHRALDDAYLHLAEAKEMWSYFIEAEGLFGEHT